jgi:hypothetical protein
MEPTNLSRLASLAGQPEKAARRYAAGDHCLVAMGEGQILATEWIKLGPAVYDEDAAELGVVFRAPANACWLYDGKTVNAEHVIGPWGAVMSQLRTYLESQGVGIAYLQVDYHNQYSIGCHKSLGFRIIGRLFCLQLFGRRFIGHRGADGRWSRIPGGEFDLRCLSLAPFALPLSPPSKEPLAPLHQPK